MPFIGNYSWSDENSILHYGSCYKTLNLGLDVWEEYYFALVPREPLAVIDPNSDIQVEWVHENLTQF